MGEDRGAAVVVAVEGESRKRARGDSGSADLERVAEILMVLSTMGRIRAGSDPTAVEKGLMVEAREKLAKFCESVEFPRRKGLFTKEMAMALVVDHGLNPPKENVSRPPRLSIAEKVAITKKKMEEAREIAAQSQAQSAQLLSVSFGVKPENRSSLFPGAQRVHPDRPTSIPLGSSHPSAQGGHAPALASSHSSLKQTHQNEIRRGLSPLKPPNNHTVSPMPEKTTELSAAVSAQINKEQDSQIPVSYTLSSFHEPSTFNSHTDISKMVQGLLPQISFDQPHWIPPSTDYINRSLNCQICKVVINDVESLLVCDACEKGVHMKCLLSFNQRIIPKSEWHCPQCLISSNGKPLPPKYGRVTRSISTSKSSSGGVQGLERKGNIESKVNGQQNLSQVSTVGSSHIESANEKKMTCQSSERKEDDETPEASMGNNFDGMSKLQYMSSGLLPCQMQQQTSEYNSLRDPQDLESSMDVDASSLGPDELSVDGIKDSSEPMKIPDPENPSSHISDDLQPAGGIDDELVKISVHEETSEDRSEPSSTGTHATEWAGDPVEAVEEKSYYHSCSINGVIYKLQDYVLISPSEGKLLPSKLQTLWEDTRSGTKWATVHCCYYPSGLPENVQKPVTPENDEVYESNVAKTILVESIHGICHVRPDKSQADDSITGLIPIFICRWFYDASNGLFRSLSQ